MRRMILVNTDKCTGCRICELTCYYFKTRKFNPKKARIRVTRLPRIGFDSVSVCLQCPDPKCVHACPEGALAKEAILGTIKLFEAKCTGCLACVDACPVGAVNIDLETGFPLICDLCGGEPKCVEYCPKDALVYERGDAVKGFQPPSRVEQATKAYVKRWGLSSDAMTGYQKL